MAKRKYAIESEAQVEESVWGEGDVILTPSAVSFQKYLHLVDAGITRYTASYLGVRYRGIMKTVDAWNEEIRIIMEEGDKK